MEPLHLPEWFGFAWTAHTDAERLIIESSLQTMVDTIFVPMARMRVEQLGGALARLATTFTFDWEMEDDAHYIVRIYPVSNDTGIVIYNGQPQVLDLTEPPAGGMV